MTGELVLDPHAWTAASNYFHAKWRADHHYPTDPASMFTYITLDGPGVYVGNSLSVASPTRIWWGEGDEKIYVDGEDFPSTFGTGTEDYYNYAWCSWDFFDSPYAAQPRCDGSETRSNFGLTSVNRWHIADPLAFDQSLRFEMEIWHKHNQIPFRRRQTPEDRWWIRLGLVNYWYAPAGTADNTPTLDPATLVVPELPEINEPQQP